MTTKPCIENSNVLLIDALKLSKHYTVERDQEARQLFEQRLAASWVLNYPEQLPITSYRELIAQAWDKHQIIIIQSETGSGKSTQLPKIALALGYARHGLIGITQPRRLATRTLASRLAQELLVRPGEVVGWQVRHQDHTQPQHLLKVMTDGLLLQEIYHDRLLNRYTCLIIDEAHERSINIDILLGYLKSILPQRPDLKIAIVSATLELDTFKSLFPQAFCLDIPGRGFPIADYYLPAEDTLSKIERVRWALDEALCLEGNILMFCATEGEISWYTQRLRELYPHLEIFQLYARMPSAQQQKIFTTGTKKRLILATNIAETSLTLPHIGSVIDTGEQKIADFNPSLKVMMYPIVPIPQSSIKQRRGRCGRNFPGHCFHLYSHEDFLKRPAHLAPEIQRSSLTQVILKLLSLGVKAIEEFPFVTMPLIKNLKEALQVLTLLGLIEKEQLLTQQGRKVAGYPIDPRFSLILLKGIDLRCAYPLVIIIGFLSGHDPRLRPAEYRALADKKHADFLDQRSDFMSILNLWVKIQAQITVLSHKKFQEYCQESFLSPMHIRAWQDNIRQLIDVFHVREQPLSMQALEQDVTLIHRALLAGFFDRVFMRQKDLTYLGPRSVKAKIHPAAACLKSKPLWLVAINTEQTQEIYLRWVGPVEIHILIEYAKHALKYKNTEPFYCAEQQEVFVFVKATLWGLPVIEGRRTLLRLTQPVEARRFFIQSWFELEKEKCFAFLPEWAKAYDEASLLAERSRDLSALKEFHELAQAALELWPQEIFNGSTLKQFNRLIPPVSTTFFLRYPLHITLQDVPNEFIVDHQKIAVEYCYDATDEHDGLTFILPVMLWRRYHPLAWLMLHPLHMRSVLEYLLHQLTKKQRHYLGDINDVVEFFLSEYKWPMPITQVLSTLLRTYYDCHVPVQLWNIDALPAYLRPWLVVEDKGCWYDLGRISISLSHEAESMIVEHDWIEEIAQSYRSGLMKAPMHTNFDLFHSYQDYFKWQAALLRAYGHYALEHISVKKSQHYQLKIKNNRYTLLYQFIALREIFFPVQLLFQHKDIFEQRIQMTHESRSTYERRVQDIEAILNPLLATPALTFKTPLFQQAFLAIKNEDFLLQLPRSLIERCSVWMYLGQQLKVKEVEKSVLCERFVEQWQSALNIIQQQMVIITQPHSLVWTVFFEWAIAELMQPMRPILPLSSKKVVEIILKSDGLKQPWC